MVTRPYVAMAAQGVVVRRAELDEVEAVLESVWELAKASATAAHWSRAALYPYVATDGASGALQAKAMFLACANPGEVGTAAGGSDKPISQMDGIVGFAAFSTVMTVGAGESTLENMVVATPWQRQGIGCRLLKAGLLWCRAYASGTVFLEVRKSNLAAIALYGRARFSVVGNRPGYYRDPAEDGLQMRRSLIPVARAG
ncbi:MAG: GNAT family N-acetyltransferase [Acidobacteriaceae bacterium]